MFCMKCVCETQPTSLVGKTIFPTPGIEPGTSLVQTCHHTIRPQERVQKFSRQADCPFAHHALPGVQHSRSHFHLAHTELTRSHRASDHTGPASLIRHIGTAITGQGLRHVRDPTSHCKDRWKPPVLFEPKLRTLVGGRFLG